MKMENHSFPSLARKRVLLEGDVLPTNYSYRENATP